MFPICFLKSGATVEKDRERERESVEGEREGMKEMY